jgi:hypothetical protein
MLLLVLWFSFLWQLNYFLRNNLFLVIYTGSIPVEGLPFFPLGKDSNLRSLEVKMVKLGVLKRNALLSLLVTCAVVGVATTSNAQSFDQEVDKVNTMSDTIAGIVASMTDVAILPMGIGASMRVFRHIVLANV